MPDWLYNAGVLKAADLNVERLKQKSKPGIAAWIARRYTRQGLWSLFLMCAFPLHAWTLILAFRDISWVTERTNAWDAVGVTSYGLVFAFVESLAVFVIAVLLGYLVPGRWDVDRRVALLTVLTLVLSIWAMFDQLYFLIGSGLPGWLINLLVNSGHPARLFYILLMGVVGFSILGPALLLMRSDRAYKFVRALIDRLSILTMFYLVLDAIGLLIVIVRNL
jgi:hypothetical protein